VSEGYTLKLIVPTLLFDFFQGAALFLSSKNYE
jgi:hypothetical protein